MKAKNTLEKTIYEKLKSFILERKILAGTQLIENNISKKLNVSRTPIRFAFKSLEEDGLVNIIPNRGTFVVNPTKDEIKEIYQVRKEIEAIAIKSAVDNIEKKDIQNLNSIIKKEKDMFYERDIFKYIKINKSFHMNIVQKSNNRFLTEIINKIINKINIYLLLNDVFYNVNLNRVSGIQEHEYIIELIEKRNKKECQNAIKRHVMRSFYNFNW